MLRARKWTCRGRNGYDQDSFGVLEAVNVRLVDA